jgi:hypothetical protein
LAGQLPEVLGGAEIDEAPTADFFWRFDVRKAKRFGTAGSVRSGCMF